jgi:chemotaxis protein CheC
MKPYMDSLNLNDLQLDALKEVANIGSARAASTLSRLLSTQIMIKTPQIITGHINDILEGINTTEIMVASVYLHFLGDITGKAVMVFPYESAQKLAYLLKDTDIKDSDEARGALLKEIVNIMFCSYLNALGKLLESVVLPSVPGMTVDMAGSALSTVLREFGCINDFLFCLETQFSFADNMESVFAHLIIIPDEHSLQTILRGLKLLQ